MTRPLLFAALAVAASLAAGGARAQATSTAASAASAGGGLEIQEGVQISTLQRMTFTAANTGGTSGTLTPSAAPMIDAIATIQVSGDPGRAYRIHLPRFVTAEGQALVESVTVHSQTGVDVADSGSVAINTDGKDIIQLKGRVRVSEASRSGAATMPLSVDVE